MTRRTPYALAAAALLACAPEPPARATQPAGLSALMSVTPLGPDDPLSVAYWPFAEADGEATPVLDAIPIGASVSAAGCAARAWPTAPLPGAGAGPWCVGRLGAGDGALLVIGRPGQPAFILAPGAAALDETTDGFDLTRRAVAPSPAALEAAARWARAPEGA